MVRTRSVAVAVAGTFVALSNTQVVVQGARLQRRRAFHEDEEKLPTGVTSYEERIAAQMVGDDPKRVQSEVEFEEALLDAETGHLQEQQRALEGMVATVQTMTESQKAGMERDIEAAIEEDAAADEAVFQFSKGDRVTRPLREWGQWFGGGRMGFRRGCKPGFVGVNVLPVYLDRKVWETKEGKMHKDAMDATSSHYRQHMWSKGMWVAKGDGEETIINKASGETEKIVRRGHQVHRLQKNKRPAFDWGAVRYSFCARELELKAGELAPGDTFGGSRLVVDLVGNPYDPEVGRSEVRAASAYNLKYDQDEDAHSRAVRDGLKMILEVAQDEVTRSDDRTIFAGIDGGLDGPGLMHDNGFATPLYVRVHSRGSGSAGVEVMTAFEYLWRMKAAYNEQVERDGGLSVTQQDKARNTGLFHRCEVHDFSSATSDDQVKSMLMFSWSHKNGLLKSAGAKQGRVKTVAKLGFWGSIVLTGAVAAKILFAKWLGYSFAQSYFHSWTSTAMNFIAIKGGHAWLGTPTIQNQMFGIPLWKASLGFQGNAYVSGIVAEYAPGVALTLGLMASNKAREAVNTLSAKTNDCIFGSMQRRKWARMVLKQYGHEHKLTEKQLKKLEGDVAKQQHKAQEKAEEGKKALQKFNGLDEEGRKIAITEEQKKAALAKFLAAKKALEEAAAEAQMLGLALSEHASGEAESSSTQLASIKE